MRPPRWRKESTRRGRGDGTYQGWPGRCRFPAAVRAPEQSPSEQPSSTSTAPIRPLTSVPQIKRFRRAVTVAYLLQLPHGLAGPAQEIDLGLAGLQPHRRAEGDATQHRHRQHLAAGQDAVHVVDMHRDQLQVGPLLAQVVQAALELADLAAPRCRPPSGKTISEWVWPISRIIRSTGLWWTLISSRSIKIA